MKKTVSIRNVESEDWDIIIKFCNDANISLSDLVSIISHKIENVYTYKEIKFELDCVNEDKLNRISKILYGE